MKLNRKKIRERVPKGWLITWEGIERHGSIVKHTIIRHEKTGIEMFLYNFDIIQYEKPKIKRHPITGRDLYLDDMTKERPLITNPRINFKQSLDLRY